MLDVEYRVHVFDCLHFDGLDDILDDDIFWDLQFGNISEEQEAAQHEDVVVEELQRSDDVQGRSHSEVDSEEEVVEADIQGIHVGHWNEEVVDELELLHSTAEDVSGYKEFKFDEEFSKQQFDLKVGQKFVNAAKFREALLEWNIRWGYEVKYEKNEGNRVTSKYNKGCTWRIHASTIGHDKTFMIKTLKSVHNCGRDYTNRHSTSRYLSKNPKTTSLTILILAQRV